MLLARVFLTTDFFFTNLIGCYTRVVPYRGLRYGGDWVPQLLWWSWQFAVQNCIKLCFMDWSVETGWSRCRANPELMSLLEVEPDKTLPQDNGPLGIQNSSRTWCSWRMTSHYNFLCFLHVEINIMDTTFSS